MIFYTHENCPKCKAFRMVLELNKAQYETKIVTNNSDKITNDLLSTPPFVVTNLGIVIDDASKICNFTKLQ